MNPRIGLKILCCVIPTEMDLVTAILFDKKKKKSFFFFFMDCFRVQGQKKSVNRYNFKKIAQTRFKQFRIVLD